MRRTKPRIDQEVRASDLVGLSPANESVIVSFETKFDNIDITYFEIEVVDRKGNIVGSILLDGPIGSGEFSTNAFKWTSVK